ncbi:hypothetical protein [Sorangium sp. So ce1078]
MVLDPPAEPLTHDVCVSERTIGPLRARCAAVGTLLVYGAGAKIVLAAS